MASKTNEQALESAIEKALTGTCLEELKENGAVEENPSSYGFNPLFDIGHAKDFDAKYALDTERFWSFLEVTQPKELEKLKRSSDWKLKILERYNRMVKKGGILPLLKKGLEVEDAHLTLFYQLPLASSAESVKENFNKNEFSVMRQVRYNLDQPLQEIDMVVFLNGIPLITLELKNAWTGQTAKVHGVKQYKTDRDPKQPLLQFGRCLVHFAVDTDEVYMATKLAGAKTFFLPFNKGHKHGKGNPLNPNGHKTAYLWEDVIQKKSLANIIEHFVKFDGKPNDPLSGKTLFFPRYHQMDVVRKLVSHTSENGVGHTYLIQHSAGSGKSYSITWTAYQLIGVHPVSEAVSGCKDITEPLFDTVIVVTDRKLLDKQLGGSIKEFAEVTNILGHASNSAELKSHLEQGKRIIITTIQKFPVIFDTIGDLSERKFAVIIDEAHSSQGGESASKMNQAMGNTESEEDEEVDVQEVILKSIEKRKMKGNASYFAFTATPKNTTLERFGERQSDGSYKPFHLYSMKQAIQEGFILDVISNYTTYKSYYEIEKSIQENPEFDKTKAQKKLRAFVERDKQTIGTKAEVMLDHFITNVYNRKKLKGKAKAMIITQSIESAIRYYKAIQKALKDKGSPFKVAIAFSGKKKVDGVEYTEKELNGFSESDTKDNFDTDEYRLLVVANKYLTGFDQPKLSAMYVDKKLQGVLCVQALSRLNRSAPKLGKKTEDLFVLDFFNSVDDIKKAFDDFYTSTTLTEATDVNVLHELKDTMGDSGIYLWEEVEEFVAKYFSNVDAQELSPIIDIPAERFNNSLELEDDEKADYKIKAKQFVKIYGQMSAIMDFSVPKWEKLFWFLKFLIPKMIVTDRTGQEIDDLLDSVDLSTYGLERTKVGASIGLDDLETELEPPNANPRGAHGGEDEKDFLDAIVESFNDKWFQGWDASPEEQRVKLISITNGVKNHKDFAKKVAQNRDASNRKLALEKILDEVIIKNRKQDIEFYQHTQDDLNKKGLLTTLLRLIDEPELL